MADKRVALLKRANKLFRQGKEVEALKEYKKILEIKSDDLEVRRIVGDLSLRLNDNPAAVEQFEWIADHYLKEGSFAKAVSMYKRITRVDPNYEPALFKLAELYTKQGLVMEAKQIYLDIAEEAKKQNNQKKALYMYKEIAEFDRSNVKLRLLLADNYLKEGLENEAINEYITAADILMNKKDYERAEATLSNLLEDVKDIRITKKLIDMYSKQGEDDKAINLLTKHEQEVFKDVELMKILGDLYLKKNMIVSAESIFSKLVEIDPEIDQGVIEGIMKVGEFYLQRKKYDKIYQLFLPLINKNIQNKKFEEAVSLLRFIIASNNSYLPALTKLAKLFKLSGNTNNLISTYKSLVPLYEEKGMKKELKGILEELIQLLDMPSSYEERLIILAEEEKNKEVILNEEWARECISKRQYADGKRYLLKVIDLNPELIQRFEEEFGFLYNLGKQTYDEEKTWKRKAGQVEWRQQVWQTLSSRNKFGLKNIDEEYIDITPDEDEIANIIDDQEDKTAEQKGKELEQAIMVLFHDFFNECKETCDISPVKERRQKGGLQFGYDLEFIICELKGNRKLKLLIECKNYTDKIKLEDIAGKLDAVKADSYFSDVDHWILISPRANATNELNRILKLWEKVGEYPFNVHLWTPETKVANFFAVNPEIYDKFFEPPKGKVYPKDWDEKQKSENIEFWKRQLEPPLRLPKGWMDYLRNPLKLRLHGDSSELENLYQHHVALKCKDESGAELAQTLEEKVLEWLDLPVSTNPSIILLGEFGDGKTVFTYLLARKLTKNFLESPSTGCIPIRFSLKDFGLETVKNSRDFVRRRLEEFGADIDGWNTLKLKKYRILAILDGFDEISKKLDHKTVFRNINELIECYKKRYNIILCMIKKPFK